MKILELRNTIIEKNSEDKHNSKLKMTEERISELTDTAMEMI